MNLPQPVQITMPEYVNNDGISIASKTFTLSEIFPLIIDDQKNKVCRVFLRPAPRPIVIWEGETYDNAGDYTQEQVENRILQILGDETKEKIQALYNRT